MIQDPYSAATVAFDLFTESYVQDQLAALDVFLSHLDTSQGPVVDIGCGSGRLLAHVLERLPDAQLIGLEPSAAMRALSLGRLSANPAWRDRVTVRPEGALEAPLPEQVSGVIMLGVFEHFAVFEPAELLRRLAARLPANAPVPLDLQLPEEPEEVARYLFADTHLGELRYRGFAEGSPRESNQCCGE